jgi:hypothetical protein
MALIVSGVGIVILNRPGTQKFTVSATCQEVRLPRGVPVYLGHEYKSVRLQGFTGRFEHIESASKGGVPQQHPNGTLNLVPQQVNLTDAPPVITVTLEKLGGALSVDARDYLQLRADGQSLELRFGPSSKAQLSGGSLKLEPTRYQDNAVETITSSIATVDGIFEAPTSQNRASVETTWGTGAGSVAISGTGGVQISGNSGNIYADGCTEEFIQVSGSDSPLQGKRDSANLVIEANQYQFEQIVMQTSSATQRASIQFKVVGESTSITEDGREAMPSLLRQVLDGKPNQLGFFGAIMIFVVLAVGTVLKRALDVFAKRLIPD